MPDVIEFVDGNTDTVLRRIPFEQVPAPNREVYLRGGVMVPTPEEADEIVPIARVVRLLVDETGAPMDEDRASRAIIREFDAAGMLLRETLQVRNRP